MLDISSLKPSFTWVLPNVFLNYGPRQSSHEARGNALVTGLDALGDAEKKSVNVSGGQEVGTYVLGVASDGFSGRIALLVDRRDTGEAFMLAEGAESSSEIKYKGVAYTMHRHGGTLELIVRM